MGWKRRTILSELSPETKRLLREFKRNQQREATSEDLKKILKPLTSNVLEEQSVFIQKAHEVLEKPKETKKKPIKKQKKPKAQETKPTLSPLEQAFVWFTTKIEEVRQQVEGLSKRLTQGHKSGVNADKVDDLHAQEIAEQALKIMQAGKFGGSGFGLKHHYQLLDVTADQHHTKYLDAEAVAAVEAEVGLTFSGGLTLSDDLDLDGNDLLNALTVQFANLQLYEESAVTLAVSAKGAPASLKNLRCLYALFNSGVMTDGYASLFRLRHASVDSTCAIETVHPAAYTTVATIRNSGEFSIERAGDITMLAGKVLTADDITMRAGTVLKTPELAESVVGGGIKVADAERLDVSDTSVRIPDFANGTPFLGDIYYKANTDEICVYEGTWKCRTVGTGADGNFTTVDGKTVTVVKGIVTSIV